jgi:2-phospho-L-lactate/phosphoenolpyruvate guanylyltransferase
MTLWAILPVKPLRLGKSRLRRVMGEEDRFLLNRGLLENTLEILSTVPEIERMLVVSHDPQVLALARGRGGQTLQENGLMDLNLALEKATRVVQSYGARRVLVLPADLPLVTREDVQKMIILADKPPVVVIAPDRHWEGTNALCLDPLTIIRYAFGAGSFIEHCRRAKLVQARLEVAEMPHLAVDLDTEEDLEFLKMLQEKTMHHGEFEISSPPKTSGSQ